MSATTIQQRQTGVFDITVRDKDGNLISLDGCDLIFQARADFGDTLLIDKISGDGIEHAADQTTTGKGLAVMTLDTTDTQDAETLRFGLWLVDVDTNNWPLIERGVLVVKPSIVDVGS